jgi:hypothetical protein
MKQADPNVRESQRPKNPNVPCRRVESSKGVAIVRDTQIEDKEGLRR